MTGEDETTAASDLPPEDTGSSGPVDAVSSVMNNVTPTEKGKLEASTDDLLSDGNNETDEIASVQEVITMDTPTNNDGTSGADFDLLGFEAPPSVAVGELSLDPFAVSESSAPATPMNDPFAAFTDGNIVSEEGAVDGDNVDPFCTNGENVYAAEESSSSLMQKEPQSEVATATDSDVGFPTESNTPSSASTGVENNMVQSQVADMTNETGTANPTTSISEEYQTATSDVDTSEMSNPLIAEQSSTSEPVNDMSGDLPTPAETNMEAAVAERNTSSDYALDSKQSQDSLIPDQPSEDTQTIDRNFNSNSADEVKESKVSGETSDDNILCQTEDAEVTTNELDQITEEQLDAIDDYVANNSNVSNDLMHAAGAVETEDAPKTPEAEPVDTLNITEQEEHQTEALAFAPQEIVVDKLPNDMLMQNATTEEEAEWLSLGLGLADALKQIVALTEERDAALVMCQEKEEESGLNAQSEALLVEVQTRLQTEMDRRAESDSEVRKLKEEIQRYEDQLLRFSTLEDDYEKAQANLVMIVSEKSKLEAEIVKLREFEDESKQKEVLLSSRLNEAKKKEANKGQAAGRLEAENEALKEELEKTKGELAATTHAKAKVESNMEKLKTKAVERVKQAETALAEERELNEERKRKMKTFVESKAEELREAKESFSDMQIELQETRTSLRSSRDREESIQQELEASRVKYRELQRDMERLKRSQQEMHKMGSTLEHELEKSASETEEHKKKRMSAKHELMTMVRTLEVEKSVSGKLRESIKFTFTPKALSQQQLLTECLKDFELELERLASKLGKTLSLPPQNAEQPSAGEPSSNVNSHDANGSAKKGRKSTRAAKADTDTERLISNLEHETQTVSKGIMSLASSIERMRSLMDEDHTFNCMAYFSNVLAAVGHQEARHQRLGNDVDNDDRGEAGNFIQNQ